MGWRGLEERHGFAGTLRRLGGLGGHFGAPQLRMNAVPAPEFVAIGHVTLDRFGDEVRPGGAALYAAVTADRLGLSAGILTSHADDFPLELIPSRIEGVSVPAPATARSSTSAASAMRCARGARSRWTRRAPATCSRRRSWRAIAATPTPGTPRRPRRAPARSRWRASAGARCRTRRACKRR